MPSRPVLALVIPAVSCIGQTLPCSGGRGAFNHVRSGLETIPNGTGAPFCPYRKRAPGLGATQAGTKTFRALPLIVRCAKPQATCLWNESSPVWGKCCGGKPTPDRRRGPGRAFVGRLKGRQKDLLRDADERAAARLSAPGDLHRGCAGPGLGAVDRAVPGRL